MNIMKINLSRTLKINTVFILHRYVCTALGCRRIRFGATVYDSDIMEVKEL